MKPYFLSYYIAVALITLAIIQGVSHLYSGIGQALVHAIGGAR